MMEIFRQRLIEMRKENGLNQRQLAKIIDVSQVAICRWELGAHIPSIENLNNLCNFFNVSADYLIGRISYEEEFGNKSE